MEYFDVCDEYGQPTGEIVERSIAHATGVRHRTAHVWIYREKDGKQELLLQKRSAQKDSFPGCYDTSSAGHVAAGTEPLESALRELEEELGIRAEREEIHPIGTFPISYASEFHGKPFVDEETAFVYVYDGEVDISRLSLQEEEVESVRWFEIGDLLRMRKENDPSICVPSGGLAMIAEYLSARS